MNYLESVSSKNYLRLKTWDWRRWYFETCWLLNIHKKITLTQIDYRGPSDSVGIKSNTSENFIRNRLRFLFIAIFLVQNLINSLYQKISIINPWFTNFIFLFNFAKGHVFKMSLRNNYLDKQTRFLGWFNLRAS